MPKAPAGRAKFEKVSRETFVTKATNVKGTPATATYAWKLVGLLEAQGVLEAASMVELSQATGIPRKFLSRAISFLTRYNRATFDEGPPVRLAPAKDGAKPTSGRRAPSKADRARLFELDGGRCGQCEQPLTLAGFAVDHIIPLSFMGADEPGNWVSLCQDDNKQKSDAFTSDYLKRFRGKRVKGQVGVRFVQGAFWPFINGRIEKATRAAWRS